MALWVERWGRGRGRVSFYPSPSGAAPKKKGTGGRGVRGGGVNHPYRLQGQGPNSEFWENFGELLCKTRANVVFLPPFNVDNSW